MIRKMLLCAHINAIIIAVPFVIYAAECTDNRSSHPEWIFCDDFEDTASLKNSYYEYKSENGSFINQTGVGLNNSRGMTGTWKAGQVSAGSLAFAFGRNPNSYMNSKKIRSTEDFRDIYYRVYLKTGTGWKGAPYKLSRATIFASATDWRQAMIAHLWSDDSTRLAADPATCVDENGIVTCTTYNDFNHLKWLGKKSGTVPIYAQSETEKWFCIEHHVKLNDPGKTNGLQEFWIDGKLEARIENLNFTGSYDAYGLNAIMLENYWNNGSPQANSRCFDNFVVSTKPIGSVEKTIIKKTGLNTLPAFEIRKIVNKSEIILQMAKQAQQFRVELFSLSGKKVACEIKIDGKQITIPIKESGVFSIRVDTGSKILTDKLLLL